MEMTEYSLVLPDEMKRQCDAAVDILEKDIQTFDSVAKSLQAFIADDELAGKAYGTLKNQIKDYLSVISALKAANEMDIEEIRALKPAMGTEELRGGQILRGMADARADMENSRERAAEYRRLERGEWLGSPMVSFYVQAAGYYETCAWLAECRYKKWQEKERIYNEKEAVTMRLLTRSRGMREAAKAALEDITGAFRDGAYHIDVNAGWRTALAKENARLFERLRQSFFTENEAGETVYDWDRIREWLEKDESEVSELEYLAFIDIMSEMSDEELECLFREAQKPVDLYGSGYDMSRVLQAAAERYLIIARIEAELTIFDSHSTYDFDETEVLNQLSRALLISRVLDSMEDNGGGKQHWVTITSEENGGKMTYTAVVETLVAAIEPDGSAASASVAKRTIHINSWGESLEAQDDLTDCEILTFRGLMPGLPETFAGMLGNETAEYIFKKIGEGTVETAGEMLSKYLGAAEFMLEMKEECETRAVVNGALDIIQLRREIQALEIGASVISVTGPAENTAYLACPKYDPEELLVRVAAYNSEHEEKTSVEEIKASFAEGGGIVEEYTDWYFDGGGKVIKEYWSELERILIIFAKENPEITDNDAKSMTIEQLQELIKKKEDPSYEINMEIMREQP